MKYKYLEQYAREKGMKTSVALEIFELESEFHKKILIESDFDKRQQLYTDLYTKIPEIAKTDSRLYFQKLLPLKTKIAFRFKKELENKSILDVGQGDGAFLYALAQTNISTKSLTGLDIIEPKFEINQISKKINSYQKNVIKFETLEKFDVIFLDNVYEHIAPQDLPFLLNSIKNAQAEKGKLILILPNKFFGPTDYTRIIDNTWSGSILAGGEHLNESTYSDVIHELKKIGYTTFQTSFPFIAFQKTRDLFPNLRLPTSIFTFIENSKWIVGLMQKIKFRGKALFRMEIIIIAQ